MQIKAILKENKDKDSFDRETHWILETNQYIVETVVFSTDEELSRFIAREPSWISPFPFPESDEFEGFSAIIIRSHDAIEYTTVLVNCFVFVTNSDGKTVDKYTTIE